jgi:ribonucleotide reductase beta subunit family protein with ferritin-like domain
VLDDITHSKKIESYFRHLRKYIPDLTQRRYREEERTIFEYLGKLTKKWFRELLKDLL